MRVMFPGLRCIYRYIRRFGRIPNLIAPGTLNEKILRKMLFDRDKKLTLFADKLLVRDLVKARLGNDSCLTGLYGVVEETSAIRDLRLPERFVMKPTHLSGEIKIVRDIKAIAPGELEKLAGIWLARNYYDDCYEWAYKDIRPRVIFEELLESGGKVPDDWKFYCFNGEPRFIQVDRDRFTGHRMNFYDLGLNMLSVVLEYGNFQEALLKPENFERMLEMARKLSSGTDFLRVDLYNIGGRVIFGELTNYPGAGMEKFEPASWDAKFGSYWK